MRDAGVMSSELEHYLLTIANLILSGSHRCISFVCVRRSFDVNKRKVHCSIAEEALLLLMSSVTERALKCGISEMAEL